MPRARRSMAASRKAKRPAAPPTPPRLVPADAHVAVVVGGTGERKISEVFLDFAEPVLDLLRGGGRTDRAHWEQALRFASIAWNAELTPDRDAALESAKRAMAGGDADPVAVAIGKIVIDTLAQRRRAKEFVHDRRVITDFEVRPGGRNELRVAVACAIGSGSFRRPQAVAAPQAPGASRIGRRPDL